MTMGTQVTGAAGHTRALWTNTDTQVAGPPEQAFAEVFGDADRVRIALWIDRTAPAHGGLFGTDMCASDLGLPEVTVRAAIGPLQHVGMVRYRGGLYTRCDHTLWSVLKVLRTFAGADLPLQADSEPSPPEPSPPRASPSRPSPVSGPHDARAATFYFG